MNTCFKSLRSVVTILALVVSLLTYSPKAHALGIIYVSGTLTSDGTQESGGENWTGVPAGQNVNVSITFFRPDGAGFNVGFFSTGWLVGEIKLTNATDGSVIVDAVGLPYGYGGIIFPFQGYSFAEAMIGLNTTYNGNPVGLNVSITPNWNGHPHVQVLINHNDVSNFTSYDDYFLSGDMLNNGICVVNNP